MVKTYNSQIPAYNTLMSALDLLADKERLETLLENISEEEEPVLEEATFEQMILFISEFDEKVETMSAQVD